jgi:hypothetical protein
MVFWRSERKVLKQWRIDAVAMEAASGSRGEHIRAREILGGQENGVVHLSGVGRT